MSNPAPVLTLFNNKGGVGKTSLIYHLAWMLSGLGMRILVCDLDPQSNLTAAFLDEDVLADLWQGDNASSTIHGCIAPLMEVGDILAPTLRKITSSLFLLPGDISLSGFEDFLSSEWPNAMGSGNLFQVLSRPDSLLAGSTTWRSANQRRPHSCGCRSKSWGHKQIRAYRIRFRPCSSRCRPFLASRSPQFRANFAPLANGLGQTRR